MKDVKTILKSLREFSKPTKLTFVYIIGEVFLEVLIPFITARVVNDIKAGAQLSSVAVTSIIMILAAMLSLLCGALAGKTAASASAGLARNVRKDMYEKVQDFSFSNIDKFSTASLVTRLTTDITNIQNAYSMIIRMFIRSPLMLLFALFMAIRISLRLSLIFFCAIPFLGICLYFIMTRVHPLFRAMFTKYDLVNRVVQENLIGIRTVKAYIREQHEIEKFEDATGQLYDYSVRAEKLIIMNSPVMQFTVYTCMLLVSWFGAHLVVGGELSTGQLMSLFTYIMQILSSLMMLSMGLTMVLMSRSSVDRVIEVLDEEIDLKNPKTNHFNAGFSDEERAKFRTLKAAGFTDTFRYLHPEEVKYSWWSYMFKAREKNAGWRIDYWLVSDRIAEKVQAAEIHNDIFGSDHCPVSIEISL